METIVYGSKYQLVSKKYSASMGYPLKVTLPNYQDLAYTMLVKDGMIIGGFLIEDVIRDHSKSTITALKKMGINCVILSGDTCNNVKRIANYVGISNFHCQLSPELKMDAVSKLQQNGDVVYIGDGINDILATKAAKLSIAFESGTDLNKSLADITITNNDIFSVYRAILLSKRTIRTVRTNFIWAIGFNMILLPLSTIGFIIP